MKLLGVFALVLIALYFFLRSDNFTSYRIMSTDELTEIKRNAAEEVYAQVQAQNPAAKSHDGSWMFDPQYRTSLEKTTVIGHPEAAKRRDHSQ